MPHSTISSHSSSKSSVYSDMSASSSTSSTPAASIAALPSFTHSLSAFPTMTAVSSDMVHYGTLGRAKQASEAKLNTALQATRQKLPGSPQSPLTSPLSFPLELPDEDQALVIPRRKSKSSSSKGGH